MKRFSNDEPDIGLLTVSWKYRSFVVRGLHPDDHVTPDDVLRAFKAENADTEVHALVLWENGQLSILDGDLFMTEVGIEEKSKTGDWQPVELEELE